MRPEDKQKYLDMIPRVFIRAVRDPMICLTEHELSEGEATDLLIKREQAAYMKGLRQAADLLRVEVDAIEIGIKKDAERARGTATPVAEEPTDA